MTLTNFLTKKNLLRPVLSLLLTLIVSASSMAQLSELEVEVNWPEWSSDNKVEVYDPSGNLILEICDPNDCQTTLVNSAFATTENIGCYLDLNNYYLIATDAYGDAWNGTGSFVEVRAAGVTVLNYDLTTGTTSGQQFFNVSGGGSCNSLDAFVEAIVAPDGSCELSSSETVTIQIRNQGSTAIASCPVEYRLNGGSYQSAGTFVGAISGGGVSNYNFSVDFSSAGTYTLDVRTQLVGDQNSSNDDFTGYSVVNSISHDFVNDGDFSMGFEAGENTAGWSIVNVNSDGFDWSLADIDFPRTGTNSASYTYSPIVDANDWLFTPCMTLEAGETYDLEYYYRVRSATYPEDVTLYLCSAPTPGAVVSTIQAYNDLTNTTYAQAQHSVTVGTSGTYYLGWHITSPADQWSFYLDDVLMALQASNDASIASIQGPGGQCSFSTTETITVTIENAGTNSLSNIPVEYSIDGGAYQSAGTFAGPLAAGATATFDFTADLSSGGIIAIDARTQLVGDAIPGNDEFTGFTVESESLDLLGGPLTMGFETTEDFTNWVILDENGDGTEWFSTTNNPNNGTRALRYNRNNSQAANDWLFTPCIYLEAGETYQASFFYRARNTNFQENLSLLLATDQTAIAASNTITSISNFNNTAYQQSVSSFTVPTSGTYYLTWRVTSAAGQRGVHIDDIQISSESNGWIGNSTAWNDANNWSAGIPTSASNVRIPTNPAGGNQPSITSAAICNDLEIDAGATVSISAAGSISIGGDLNGSFALTSGEVIFNGSASQTVTGESAFSDLTIDNAVSVVLNNPQTVSGTLDLVNGVLTTNGNEFTLLSDASGTARIAAVTNGSISGNVTVQRYINAGATNWRFLAAPVTGINFEEWDDDMITSGFIGSDFPAFPFTSIYTYNETLPGSGDVGFTPLVSSSQSLNMGEGYWVWCGDNSSGTAAFNIDVTGPIHTGDFDLNVSYTGSTGATQDGWTMVGNPYASAIDWDSPGWTKTNMNNAVYIWDPDLGQYATYIGGVGANGGSRYIASSQAFWVQANGNSPQLRITESAKADQEPVFFDQEIAKNPTLALLVSRNGFSDETVVQFRKDGAVPFQPMLDARKKYGSTPQAPNVSSISDGDHFAINSLPELTYRVTLPIEVLVGVSGNYTLELSQFDNFDATACIVLEDKLLETFTDLRNQAAYSCQIDDTTSSARFVLHISKGLKKAVRQVSCNGKQDAQIRVTTDGVEGPWDYLWKDELGAVIKEKNYHGTTNSIRNLGPGRYYVEVSSDGICPLMRDSFRITEPDPVVADFTASSYLVDLAGDPTVDFTNLSTGSSVYAWRFGDGGFSSEENPEYTFGEAGFYKVKLTAKNENGCPETAIHNVVVVDTRMPLGVENTNANSGALIEIYGSGSLYAINFNLAQSQEVLVSIIDMQGRVVMTKSANGVLNTRVPLDLSSLAAGGYVITVQSETLAPFSQTVSVQ